MLLDKKVCLVTGAGKGIGRAILDAFLKEGAFVFANDIKEGSLEDYHDNNSVDIMYFDVSCSEHVKAAMLHINGTKKGLNVLVNNAGIMQDALIGSVSRQLMERLFAVNVFGSMEIMQYVAKNMMRHKSGSIINISSIVGITGNPGQLVYSSTKGAIIAMTKTAAKELAPRGIRVNAIAPGMIDTDMLRSIGEEHLKAHLNNIPMGRLGLPNEIADACLYLASDMSSYVTGQILSVDGKVTV